MRKKSTVYLVLTIVLLGVFIVAGWIVRRLVLTDDIVVKDEKYTENQNAAEADRQARLIRPVFSDVTVHDPAIIRVEDTYYVFGSHLASAKSNDLMRWTQLSTRVIQGNILIPNVKEELAEVFEWAQTNTLWAPEVIQLEDGRFYMYYSACRGDSPLSGLGIAVSDNIIGPYKDLGIILKSGMWGLPSEDGRIYDANYHPNVVDPDVFFDSKGNLWMVYGSYSGGIFIMELDRDTGFPYPEQGYGKKLTGGYHARIEGPHILHNPETGYYYLFLSFGGLAADGGYNIRVARSRNPDGPYVDSMGNEMIDAKGMKGTLFHDPSIEPYGTKLIGNYRFLLSENEPGIMSTGYVSPGHSSAYHNEETNKYYLFFHTRFANRGEIHEVRVHQIIFNQDGWPVIVPYRYADETIGVYTKDEISGQWKIIDHGRDISVEVKNSSEISLNDDGSISGELKGTWSIINDRYAELTIDDILYRGIFLKQWDTNNMQNTMTFSVLSEEKGVALWGGKVVTDVNR